MIQYEEFAPLPTLAAVVDCLWTLSGDAADLGADTQPVLPDGRPELILHFGDIFERIHDDGRIERQASVIFAGQLTAQLSLRPTGRIGVLGLRFHPYGAAAVFDAPQHELAGLTVGVDAIARPLARSLEEVRAATNDPTEAAVLVQHALMRWIDPARIDPRVRHAALAIAQRRGRISIDDVAETVSLTRRHLERRFLTSIGISPKRLARIARFQHALRVLDRSGSERPGTLAAAACGYADQAHFIRDFRDLAGCPPGEHLLRQAELTGAFIGNRGIGESGNR